MNEIDEVFCVFSVDYGGSTLLERVFLKEEDALEFVKKQENKNTRLEWYVYNEQVF